MSRPFRLCTPRVPEIDLHRNIADGLAKLVAPPAEWTCFPAGHIKLSVEDAEKLYRLGLKPSWPDFLVLSTHLYGIEVKAEGGTLSKTRWRRTRRTGRLRLVEGQEDVFPRLLKAGMKDIATCGSLEEVLAQLRAWGVPLRISAGSELVEAIPI